MIAKLIESGVCFAIVQSYSYFTKAKIMENQEWEIIASEIDKEKLSGLGFFKNTSFYTPESQKNPEGILSKVLKPNEIREFKDRIPDYFTKVKETPEGKVWELKEKSFKQYLKAS